MLVSYNYIDGLLGYTSETESANSTSVIQDSNSTLADDEQLDDDAVSSNSVQLRHRRKKYAARSIKYFTIRVSESLTWPHSLLSTSS